MKIPIFNIVQVMKLLIVLNNNSNNNFFKLNKI